MSGKEKTNIPPKPAAPSSSPLPSAKAAPPVSKARPKTEQVPPRRGFLSAALAVVIGGIVAIFPFAAGLAVFADPLRKRTGQGAGRRDSEGFVRIDGATLDALPVGLPRRFVVIDDMTDAWNIFPNEPIGAVYLTRSADNSVAALNVTCPHAGCAVDYKPSDHVFRCPCHDSSFKPDGELARLQSPSPRGLDPLEVRIKDGQEVWVKYLKFRGGVPERIVET